MGKRPYKKKGPKTPIQKTRKELRKEQRKEKKLKRTMRYQRGQNQSQPESSVSKSPADKKPEITPGLSSTKQGFQNNVEQIRNKEKQEFKKLQSKMNETRKKLLLSMNEEEDRTISQLEKLLKIKQRKTKSLPKAFVDDGLGYLLEVCDPETRKECAKVDEALHQDSGSEFEEDFAVVTGKKNKKKTKCSVKNLSANDEVSEDAEMPSNEESGDNFGLSGDSSSDEDLPDDRIILKEKQNNVKKKKIHSGSKKQEVSCDVSEASSNDDSESDFGLGDDDGSAEEMSDADFDDEDEHISESDNVSEEEEEDSSHESEDGNNDLELRKGPASRRRGEDDINMSKDKRINRKNQLPSSVESNKSLPKMSKNNSSKYEEEHSDDSNAEDSNEFENDSENEEGSTSNVPSTGNADGTWEDIYGRTRDKEGNVVEAKAAKYIPPALRAKLSGDEDAKRKESQARLRRQIKGLMNRLAENNISSICTQMDQLYMQNSRNDMNEALLGIILDALVSSTLSPERLVMEHMLLIAALHANVGTEIGAYFLQNVMKKFSEMLEQSPEVENKELDNLVLILSHLYNFKIFTASLMYEVLEKIAETLDEKRIELLLLVLRSVGFSLRKDDPLALKGLIFKLQGKVSNCLSATNSRVKFMLDTLMAIKNNNMSKIPSYNPEHIEHLKKVLRSLLRRGNHVTELKISLDDLLKADERGRWWIVGSAWTGHLPGESQSENQSTLPKACEKSSQLKGSSYTTELLELARKQRMNTGIRKDIFCILMTAEDYLDAFEKLLHLNLKNQQRQDIVHVLFDCCIQEKSFNPYYAHVAQKFCDFDRQYQLTFQYCCWDRLKELDNLRSTQISNMAKLLAHLFLEKGLPISALKVMSFAEMGKACIRLVRQILLIVLLCEDSSKCDAVFRRIAPSAQLHLFREGLRLFISHFVLRKSNSGSLPKDELELLEDRAKLANRALSSAEARMEF